MSVFGLSNWCRYVGSLATIEFLEWIALKATMGALGQVLSIFFICVSILLGYLPKHYFRNSLCCLLVNFILTLDLADSEVPWRRVNIHVWPQTRGIFFLRNWDGLSLGLQERSLLLRSRDLLDIGNWTGVDRLAITEDQQILAARRNTCGLFGISLKSTIGSSYLWSNSEIVSIRVIFQKGSFGQQLLLALVLVK